MKEQVYCPICFQPMHPSPVDPNDGYYYCFGMHEGGKPVRVPAKKDEEKSNG